MRTHTATTKLALCAAVLLTAGVGTASAAPTDTPPAARTAHHTSDGPVLVDCLWHAQTRPADFTLACGDGNSRLTSLHWSAWDADSATARGTNMVNDCVPYCAAGHFHAYPVTVRLERPEPWPKQPGARQFTQLSLTYTDGRPDGFARVTTVPLWK
ncbi:hypothetical protein GCM10010129_74750 [Streptomyces fumigatiscleroticus]|nr:hypothetical protein GCM10010129_74750 [Streptomyces fumigatiscleroticus]